MKPCCLCTTYFSWITIQAGNHVITSRLHTHKETRHALVSAIFVMAHAMQAEPEQYQVERDTAGENTHYPQATTMAAKVPKVEMTGTSARLVKTKAQPVVNEVTDIAFMARDQLHWNRISSDPLTLRG